MEIIEAYKGIEMWVMYVKFEIDLINLSDQTEKVNGDMDGNN